MWKWSWNVELAAPCSLFRWNWESGEHMAFTSPWTAAGDSEKVEFQGSVLGREAFGRGGKGAVTVIFITLETRGSSWGKSLAELAFGSPHKGRAILHQSIYNLNGNWMEKIIYSALWFFRQVNRRKLNLSDSSWVTWGFCSTAGNKPR